MKRFLAVALACSVLALAGCTDNQVAQVQDIAKKTCGVIPAAADVAAVFNVPGAPVAVVFADMICKQYVAKKSVKSLVDDGCIATVNGVCIHEEKKDGK